MCFDFLYISLYLVDRVSFIKSFYFFFQLDTLIFSFFTFTIFLYMFRTGWSIIRRIKSFDSPDDGPAGPKHVEKNCKCKKGKYKCIKLEKEIKRIYK